MVRGLKIALVIYGALTIVLGLMDITMHELVAQMFSFRQAPIYVNWMGELIGAIFIAIGVWVIIAARDPIQHINWVKFVITMSILAVAVSAHSIIVGYVSFSQIQGPMVFDSISAVAFLVLYPWRVARAGREVPVAKA